MTKNTSTPVTVKCTLANVKVTVNFDGSMNQFQSATATIASGLSGVVPREFEMGKINKSAYFPVGSLTLTLAVLTDNNKLHTQNYAIKPTNRDVQARDHFIINFKVPTYGSMDRITITADDETKNYTINFPVYRYPRTTLRVEAANAWSSFAYVQGTAISADNTNFDTAKMQFQYKEKSATTWQKVGVTATNVIDGVYGYKATLPSLSPNTDYEYRLAYNDAEYTSDAVTFTTEKQPIVPNLSFDDWTYSDKAWYPKAEGDTIFWDTGNGGAKTAGINPTTREDTDVKQGKAARMESKLVDMAIVKAFAAGNIYTGKFQKAIVNLSNPGAELSFGQPFTGRPSQLSGYYKYNPGTIDCIKADKVSAVKEGDKDRCSIYIALMDWTAPFKVNTTTSTFVDFSDPSVIAYGELSADECSPESMSNYERFTISLKYRDLTKKPTYILIVASASKYGDYFTGSTSSVLLIDEFELIYGEPTIDTEYITTK